MDTKGLFVTAFLFFVLVFTAAWTLPVVDHNSSVQQNEPVDATILDVDIETQVDDGDTEYTPVITYEYEVGGDTYTAENVYPGQFVRWHDSRSSAEEATDQYDVGETATAYYNPADPQEAYLFNPGWPSGWFITIGSILVGLLGGGWLVRKGFRRWRQRMLITNTPTEQARSLSIGPSEVMGSAVPASEPLTAPFSDEECVVAEYKIEEYDTSGDNNSWKTKDEDVLSCPFYVDDGTGQILVRPHEDATYDLDPDDWATTRVDSSDRGPEAVQEFIDGRDDLDYPRDSRGKNNDRRYKQNLIRTGDSVYVFGTVQPREDVAQGADNAERLLIQQVEDDSMRQLMFLISDDEPDSLIDRRRWALWRAPVGGFFIVVAFITALLVLAPFLGIPVPRIFDGIISSTS